MRGDRREFVLFSSSSAGEASLSICTLPRLGDRYPVVLARNQSFIRDLRQIKMSPRTAARQLLLPLTFAKPDHGKETDMTQTLMRSRCPQRSSSQAKAKVHPLVKRPTLVPEAKVKAMLRDIAFVLHVTRRLTKEMGEPNTCSGAS